MSRFVFVLVFALGCGSAPPPKPAPGSDLRFVVQQADQNPLVAVRLVFDVGSVDDPPGKAGLAALTGAMIGAGGSTARTYAELLDALYPMAADLDVQVDKELTAISGMVHRDNVAAWVELMLDQVITPRFDPADFTRNRDKAVDFITKTVRSDDDEVLGKLALESALYAGHPYAHPIRGTEAGLKAITLDDLKAFHRSHYTQDRLLIGLGGGVPRDLRASMTTRLALLPEGSTDRPVLPAIAPATARSALIVDKPGRSAAISIGHPHPLTRADDDFYPLFVAINYLGDHRTFNGVLMQNMRGKRGLNYGDYAYVEAFVQDGWSTFPLPNVLRSQQRFEIWIRPVPADKAGFALRQALYETDKLIREGIPQGAFDETRQYLMAYSKLWTQDANRRLGYTLDGIIAGRTLVTELNARLETMTKADVDAAIRKYLSIDDVTIAIVAPEAEALEARLVAGEKTPMVYDTEGTPAEVLAEDAIIEVFPLKLDATRIRTVPAAEIFGR